MGQQGTTCIQPVVASSSLLLYYEVYALGLEPRGWVRQGVPRAPGGGGGAIRCIVSAKVEVRREFSRNLSFYRPYAADFTPPPGIAEAMQRIARPPPELLKLCSGLHAPPNSGAWGVELAA